MDVQSLLAKINKADLTDEEILALDAMQTGVMTADDVAKATSAAIREALEPLLKAKQAPPMQEPAAYKPLRNGYSDMVRNILASKDAATAVEAMKFFDEHNIKAMSVSSSASGGYTVPNEWVPEILKFMNEYGALRQFATVIPTQAQALYLTSKSTGMTAYWTTEVAAATQTAPTYSQVTLTPAFMQVLSDPISKMLIADSFADILAEVGQEAMEAMAYLEDYTGFLGDGTATYGSFTGILLHGSVNAVTSAGTVTQITYDDLVDCIKALPANRRIGASWNGHRTVIAELEKIKDDNGMPIFNRNPVNGFEDRLLGYPVHEIEAMPDTTGLSSADAVLTFGNLANCVRIYDREELFIDVSGYSYTGSVDLFSTNQVVVKHIIREGIVVARPTGLVNLVLA